MFALNQGEVCTCPSRALVQASIYDQFVGDAIERTEAIMQGNPLDTDTMIGAQACNDQLEKILSYLDIGKQEGAQVLTGGDRADLGGDLAGGYYVQPTIFEGHNEMRIFQEEIFGPVVSVTRFDDEDDAIKIANDTLYGLGAGVWTRDGTTAYRAGREIQAGRVWTNCYHPYPAHAAFGGYKQSGVGRENHKMMLDHYQQTKNLLVSLLAQGARLLLDDDGHRVDTSSTRPAEAAELLRRLRASHGPLMFHQSGGCCDGSSPMCYPDGDFHHRRLRRAARRPGRRGCRTGAGLDVGGAVRVLEAHPSDRRRRTRPRQRVLGGGTGGRAVPDPVAPAHR